MEVHIENSGINKWANELYFAEVRILLNGAILSGIFYRLI